MSKTYYIETKQLARGRNVKIYFNGELIGERTSPRPYQFALIVRPNAAWEAANQRKLAEEALKQAANYDELAESLKRGDRSSEACRVYIHRYGYANIVRFEGKFAEWADTARAAAARHTAFAESIEANPNSPQWTKPFVASWHLSRHNVPSTVPDHQIFVDVIQLPE